MMSAKEELHESLCASCSGQRAQAPGECESVGVLIDNYAHELAEKQRREMHVPGQSYDAESWNRCVGMTADLIDPEVTR